MIRALVVDHDVQARQWIRAQLALETDVEAIGECTNVVDAFESIHLLRPDVVITEAEIDHCSCFDMLSSLSGTKIPYVIVTSFTDRHALKAFDVNVTDYILKPVGSVRLKAALLSVRQGIERDMQLDRRIDLDQLVRQLKSYSQKTSANRSTERVPIKFGHRHRFIHMATIAHIQAEGNSVDISMVTGEVLHAGDRMFEIEPRLPGERFLRIHRSAIVNIEHIREVRTSGGECEIVMNDNRAFKVGSTYRARVKKHLLSGKAHVESVMRALPA